MDGQEIEEKGRKHIRILKRIKKITLELEFLDLERKELWPYRIEYNKIKQRERDHRLFRLKEKGVTIKFIAAKEGLNVGTVSRAIARYKEYNG